jgi:hypothetical protein
MSKYAYSYDREDYTGSYDTPEDALADAIKRSEVLSNPPTEIYVGQIVQADPQADDHAAAVIEHMSQRAHVDFGEPARRYLKKLPRKLVKELDDALAATILDWLKRNNLMPTFVQVRGIREYPVPVPSSKVRRGKADPSEVYDLGSAEMPDMSSAGNNGA